MKPDADKLPPRPRRTEDRNGNKKHYAADDVDAYMNSLEAENESLKAANKEKEDLVRQLHEANFRQAAKINSIVGARAEFADTLLKLFGFTMYTEEYENASIIREVKAVIERAQRAEAERDEALEVIREFYIRTGIIDNGRCAVCRQGYRSWKLPGCKVPSGPCSNENCLSRKADALLSREMKET